MYVSVSSELSPDDNHTLSDKTTLYKTCEPIKRLPKCRYFKDAAWTIYSFPDTNATQQIVNCHCPKASMTYLLKKLSYTTASGELGNQYQFACSPLSVSISLPTKRWRYFYFLGKIFDLHHNTTVKKIVLY